MAKFLAFDCASEEIIVIVGDEKREIVIREKASGTEYLMVAIDKALNEIGFKISDIEIIGVGIGPGSWTGSRVAVTTALGFISALKNVKIFTFNSFDLISYYKIDNIKSVRLVKAYANFVFCSPNNEEFYCLTKDEFNAVYSEYKKFSKDKLFDDVIVQDVDISTVVKEKIKNKQFVNIREIEPMYLRASQAEIQFKERLKK